MRLLEEIYRDICSWEYITPKQMANLICGNDPSERSLKHEVGSDYCKTLQRIRDAKNRGDIDFYEKLTIDSKLNRKALFEWAIPIFDDWAKNTHDIRLLYESKVGNASGSICAVNISAPTGFAYSASNDLLKLQQEYCEAMGIIHELKNEHKQKIQDLTAEIERLSVFEQKEIERKKKRKADGRIGGLASKGKKKNY